MNRALFTLAILGLVLLPQTPAQIRLGGDAEPAARGGQEAPQELTEAQSAWIRKLAARIADEDRMIARSAQSAVSAFGRAALPILEELAGGEDAKVAAEAKRMVERLSRARGGRDTGGRGGFGAGGTDRLLEGIELSESERKAFDAVMEKQTAEMRKLFERGQSGEIDRREVFRLMGEARENTMKELEKALPAEKVEQLRERMSRGGGRGGFGGGAGGGRRRGDG